MSKLAALLGHEPPLPTTTPLPTTETSNDMTLKRNTLSLPIEANRQVRILAAEHDTKGHLVLRALIEHGLETLVDDPALLRRIDELTAEDLAARRRRGGERP